MYVEERVYTLKGGTVPVGYYFTETAPLNTIGHMWAYESLDDRLKKMLKA